MTCRSFGTLLPERLGMRPSSFAMPIIAGSDEIDETMGWPRGPRGGSVRRIWNLGSDLGGLTVGAAAVAARRRSDAWFSPANVLPLALPRPKIESILDTNVVTARDLAGQRTAGW